MEPATLTEPADDALLLRCYVREGSEAAFRALAGRYLPLVWSVARRVVHGDGSLAEDVAQMVLADFATKAHALPPGMPPAGWLHRHTVFTAGKVLRGEARRRARELKASAGEPATTAVNPHTDTWSELAPHIDTALDRLAAADRAAIILRYYEQRPLREIGRTLGMTEDAARKRIDRALEKLRSHLRRRGVVPAVAVLALSLRDHSVAAPSVAIGRRIVSAAWQSLETGGSVVALQPWWRKRRMVLAGGVAALLVTGLMWLAWRGILSDPGDGPSRKRALRLPEIPNAASAKEENFPPVTFTATLMTLPEKSVFARMLNYEPGTDDAALYRDLLPQAEALQKLVKPDETFATSAHPLVVLSGEAKPKRMAPKKPLEPDNSVPPSADPFGPAPEPPPPAPSIKLQSIKEFPYQTEWPYDSVTGRITPSEPTMTARHAGTQIEANVSPPDADGLRLIECSVDHMFAPPEIESWPYRRLEEGDAPEDGAVQQPVFYSANWHLPPLPVPAGKAVLAGSMFLPADVLPAADQEPRRLFLFLTVNP